MISENLKAELKKYVSSPQKKSPVRDIIEVVVVLTILGIVLCLAFAI